MPAAIVTRDHYQAARLPSSPPSPPPVGPGPRRGPRCRGAECDLPGRDLGRRPRRPPSDPRRRRRRPPPTPPPAAAPLPSRHRLPPAAAAAPATHPAGPVRRQLSNRSGPAHSPNAVQSRCRDRITAMAKSLLSLPPPSKTQPLRSPPPRCRCGPSSARPPPLIRPPSSRTFHPSIVPCPLRPPSLLLIRRPIRSRRPLAR